MLKENISNYLFLDIETVPQYPDFDQVPEHFKILWDKKTKYQRKENESPKDFYGKAGIWAEFGKVVCISCGIIDRTNKLRIKSFFGDDEKLLLADFSAMLAKLSYPSIPGKSPKLCAHNGKEFDFPFLARRMLINAMPLPQVLDSKGLKPWEVPFVDTMELWKFGDYKHYCSLELLAAIFGIPSPKDDIDGSMVAKVYYEDKDLQRIAVYCEKDVVTLAELFLKMNGAPRFAEVAGTINES